MNLFDRRHLVHVRELSLLTALFLISGGGPAARAAARINLLIAQASSEYSDDYQPNDAVAQASSEYSDDYPPNDDVGEDNPVDNQDHEENGVGVPEFTTRSAAPALALLVGGALIIAARRRRRAR